jgi:hypothetical protein
MMSRLLAVPAILALSLNLSGCDGGRAVREAPLPPSQRESPLGSFQPPEALDYLEQWYPRDWRLHLLRALADSSWQAKVAGLRTADSLFPGEPLIAYHLCLAFLERERPEEERLARPYLEKALVRDPGNGILRVIEAYLLLRENRLGEARALFGDPRRLPRGDFHYPRLEEAVLGLFSHAGYLNPYTLTEAVDLYRRIPLPPFEKWVGILYAVFLSPLPEHPYDIRVRGQEAADGLFRLGRALRIGSYSGPKVLSDGYEQRALGFMFQLKAAEFLTLFYRTFEDTAGSERAFRDLVDVQREYEAFMASRPWQDAAAGEYLDDWSRLIADHPGMPIAQAVDQAREWKLWKKAMRFRYPRRDDP